MVYKNKSDDYKNNYCVDVVMIWLQTVANIIHIQVLFWRDCAGFGVSPLIWDRAPRPDARQPLDRRPGQPPGLFPDFCPMSLFPLYEGYIDKETRKLRNKQFAASKRCIGEEIKRQMSHNIYI